MSIALEYLDIEMLKYHQVLLKKLVISVMYSACVLNKLMRYDFSSFTHSNLK